MELASFKLGRGTTLVFISIMADLRTNVLLLLYWKLHDLQIGGVVVSSVGVGKATKVGSAYRPLKVNSNTVNCPASQVIFTSPRHPVITCRRPSTKKYIVTDSKLED